MLAGEGGVGVPRWAAMNGAQVLCRQAVTFWGRMPSGCWNNATHVAPFAVVPFHLLHLAAIE